jgi:hypothetical protein
LNPSRGLCFWATIDEISCDTSINSCSRDGGLDAAFRAAVVSCAISIGPPGSAIVMAAATTNGDRLKCIHSLST